MLFFFLFFFLFLQKKICCRYSLELPHCGDFNELLKENVWRNTRAMMAL